MSGGFRHVAPAGAPIHLTDLARWAGSARRGTARLRETLAGQFGVRDVFLTSTGRAGMTLLLRSLRRLATADRDEVVLPSYTCYSVAAAIVKAGLRPRVLDVDPGTLDFVPTELERQDFSRALAFIATNLYGLPDDLPALTRTARRWGAYVIDDAAQAMGASVGGRWSGTWGDAGLFSFDKGKNVAAIDGGAIVTDSPEVATAIESEMKALPSPGLPAAAAGVSKAVAYSLLLRPWLYGIPASIPQLELGKTVFSTEFPVEAPIPSLAALAATMMHRLDEFTEARRVNAARLESELRRLPGITLPRSAADSHPVYLRFPALMPDRTTRDAALAKLSGRGIGATGSYPLSIGDIPELDGRITAHGGMAGGRAVADRIVTLPTHPYVTVADLNVMAGTLKSLLHESPVSGVHLAAQSGAK